MPGLEAETNCDQGHRSQWETQVSLMKFKPATPVSVTVRGYDAVADFTKGRAIK